MLLKIEKAILALFTGVFPVFIAACYGPAAYEPGEDSNFSGNTDTGPVVEGEVKDMNGAPIPNILVRCMSGETEVDSTYTLAGDGSFRFDSLFQDEMCDRLRFEDVDGEDNGGVFAAKDVVYAGEDFVQVTLALEE